MSAASRSRGPLPNFGTGRLLDRKWPQVVDSPAFRSIKPHCRIVHPACKRSRHRSDRHPAPSAAGPVAQWLEPAAHNVLGCRSSPVGPPAFRSRAMKGCRARSHLAKAGVSASSRRGKPPSRQQSSPRPNIENNPCQVSVGRGVHALRQTVLDTSGKSRQDSHHRPFCCFSDHHTTSCLHIDLSSVLPLFVIVESAALVARGGRYQLSIPCRTPDQRRPFNGPRHTPPIGRCNLLCNAHQYRPNIRPPLAIEAHHFALSIGRNPRGRLYRMPGRRCDLKSRLANPFIRFLAGEVIRRNSFTLHECRSMRGMREMDRLDGLPSGIVFGH